jgi:hypothetical protein
MVGRDNLSRHDGGAGRLEQASERRVLNDEFTTCAAKMPE